MPLRAVLLLLCVLGCVVAPPTFAGPGMLVGASEDSPKQLDVFGAKTKMDLAQLAGFDVIRMTTPGWVPGKVSASSEELLPLQNAVAAAQLDGIRVILSVTTEKVAYTPLTAAARAGFAGYAASLARSLPGVTDFVIGNEPNLNRFWWPQFDARGRDVAAPAYDKLLAATYDALKAVSPTIRVIGGAVSPRGGDNPNATRKTHSPTTFIPDLGAAYRASGRTKPIMDAFAFHPYMEYSRTPPTLRHPLTSTIELSDYDKLVALLGKAFNGTPQVGSRIPIVYDEFGVQTKIPPLKATSYTNLEVPSGADAISEALQGAYYRQALAIAYCQRTVEAFMFFHVSDEPDLDRWQSGLYYADDTPKSDLPQVRQTIDEVRTGKLSCRAPLSGGVEVTSWVPHRRRYSFSP